MKYRVMKWPHNRLVCGSDSKKDIKDFLAEQPPEDLPYLWVCDEAGDVVYQPNVDIK